MTRLWIALWVLTSSAPAWAFHEVASFERSANTGGGSGYYYTGSPRYKGYDCNLCHTGAEGRIAIEISGNLTSGRYQPGLIYTINVKLVGEHRGLESAFNPNTFTAEILDDDGTPVGGLSASRLSIVEINDEEQVAIAEGQGNGETEWQFSWFAPEQPVPATLYLALLDGDGASDPVRRFIDPLNDDVATTRLRLCPDGLDCDAPEQPTNDETSPAGCSTGSGTPRTPQLVLLVLVLLQTGRSRRRSRS